MPYNNWDVQYSTICYFESILNNHQKVITFKRNKDIFFEILRVEPFSVLKVLLVDEYTISIAAIIRAKKEFSQIEHIVTGSKWNGYSRDAKEYGYGINIGVFVIDEFIGAMNFKNPIEYVMRDKDGSSVYKYKQ